MENVSTVKKLRVLFKKSRSLRKVLKIYLAPFIIVFADYENSYDSSLCRLMVRPWDNWRGINPSGVGEFTPDPPIFAAKFANNENYNHIIAIANEDGRVIFLKPINLSSY